MNHSYKETKECILSDEERKFLHLCLKSKNIPLYKNKTVKEKVLDKVKSLFQK